MKRPIVVEELQYTKGTVGKMVSGKIDTNLYKESDGESPSLSLCIVVSCFVAGVKLFDEPPVTVPPTL
jgi:hypothetical protein